MDLTDDAAYDIDYTTEAGGVIMKGKQGGAKRKNLWRSAGKKGKSKKAYRFVSVRFGLDATSDLIGKLKEKGVEVFTFGASQNGVLESSRFLSDWQAGTDSEALQVNGLQACLKERGLQLSQVRIVIVEGEEYKTTLLYLDFDNKCRPVNPELDRLVMPQFKRLFRRAVCVTRGADNVEIKLTKPVGARDRYSIKNKLALIMIAGIKDISFVD